MDSYVCTIGGGKGGIGKTTVTINLGAAIADRGHSTVLVDGDLRMANLASLLDIETGSSIHDVLSDTASVTDAITTVSNRLSVLPGTREIEAFADADPSDLPSVITSLRHEYDVVLVDSAPGVSHEVAAALGCADGIVLVATPDGIAMNDASSTADLADHVDGTVLGTVVNRARSPTDLDVASGPDVGPTLGVVPDDTSATGQEPLVRHAPNSTAADAFTGLADALLTAWFGDEPLDAREPVYEAEWFEDGTVDDAQQSDDVEESGNEVFGLFN